MPGRTLPTLTRADVEEHTSEESCYVTIGDKIYDVTDFLDEHPGGSDLILDHAGKDIEDILKDPVSHPHSEVAYDILDESLVGFLVSEKSASANGKSSEKADANGSAAPNGSAGDGTYVHPRTGMSSEEDLSKDTDYSSDYKKHKFLDLNKPLFLQLWNGGFSKEFYLDQVHRPRHYKGGKSAPLFGNFLEPLSLTPWWLVPTLWIPCVCYGMYVASQGLSVLPQAGYFLFGLFFWTIIEYGLHRFLFHLDGYVPPPLIPIPARLLTRPALAGTCLTTALASACTSCCTASTTTCPWTDTAWSCPRPCSSSWLRPSGSLRTRSSSGTGSAPWPGSAAASSGTYATT